MPNLPSPPSFLEDERNVLDAEFDAVDWLTVGVRPVVDVEADLVSWR